jgi:hypothetical protein
MITWMPSVSRYLVEVVVSTFKRRPRCLSQNRESFRHRLVEVLKLLSAYELVLPIPQIGASLLCLQPARASLPNPLHERAAPPCSTKVLLFTKAKVDNHTLVFLVTPILAFRVSEVIASSREGYVLRMRPDHVTEVRSWLIPCLFFHRCWHWAEEVFG